MVLLLANDQHAVAVGSFRWAAHPLHSIVGCFWYSCDQPDERILHVITILPIRYDYHALLPRAVHQQIAVVRLRSVVSAELSLHMTVGLDSERFQPTCAVALVVAFSRDRPLADSADSSCIGRQHPIRQRLTNNLYRDFFR